MNTAIFKMKALILSFMLSFAIPTHLLAQVSQAPQELQLTYFTNNSQNIERGLSIGVYAALPFAVGGLASLIAGAIARKFSGTEDGALHGFGSSPCLIASGVSTVFGFLALASIGFPWLAVNQQLQTLIQEFQPLAPYVTFECHILTPIAYAPVNISCNRSSSFVQASGASLLGGTDWNFDDGLGFQNMSETVSTYTLQNPGKYSIQIRLNDTNQNVGIGSFDLLVSDGNPQIKTSLSFSNPYQSVPVNVTFSIGPVQVVYPCSTATAFLTLPNENTTALSPNETNVFTRNYTVAGIYNYQITVIDSSGRVTSNDLTFNAQSPDPIVIINLINCDGGGYYGLDPSQSRVNTNTTIVSYTWTSDDGSISGTTYPPNGVISGYTIWDEVAVSLTVSDALNHSTTVNGLLFVNDDCQYMNN